MGWWFYYPHFPFPPVNKQLNTLNAVLLIKAREFSFCSGASRVLWFQERLGGGKVLLLLPINGYQCLISCGLLIGSHGPQPSISFSLELKPGSWTGQCVDAGCEFKPLFHELKLKLLEGREIHVGFRVCKERAQL